MFPKIKLGNLLDGMAAPTKGIAYENILLPSRPLTDNQPGREAQEAITAQAIKEIEQGLGDVGREYTTMSDCLLLIDD
jgi:hypothetical protein